MYHTNTRQHANLHKTFINVTKFQKGVYCLGVKLFNMLPDNPKKFKVILQKLYIKILFIVWRMILN